jgi:hypothetical protein
MATIGNSCFSKKYGQILKIFTSETIWPNKVTFYRNISRPDKVPHYRYSMFFELTHVQIDQLYHIVVSSRSFRERDSNTQL